MLDRFHYAVSCLAVVGSVLLQTAGAIEQVAPEVVSVSGRVIHENSQRPLVQVRVTLTPERGPALFSAFSDSDGVFHLSRVPPGRYSIKAAKPGYALPPWKPGRPSRLIVVGGAKPVPVVEIPLVRGAALGGTVLTALHRPAPGVRMLLTRCQGLGDCSASAGHIVATTTADGDGLFRFFGLQAGAYGLAAGGDLPPETLPTYFPGTADAARASFVVLGEEEERSDIRLTLEQGTTRRIAGQVLAPDGRPAGRVPIQIFPALPVAANLSLGEFRVDETGGFVSGPLAPSIYRIGLRIDPNDGSSMLWAVTNVSLGSQDISGVRLTLKPTTRLSGQFVADDSVAVTPGLLGGILLELTRSDTPVPVSTFDVVRAVSDINGRILVPSVIPGRFRAHYAVPANRDISVKGLRLSGQAIQNDEVEIQSTAPGHLEVLVTSRHTLVAGEVRAPDGQPAPEFSVVVFSARRSEWVPGSRRVAVAGVAPDGTFQIRALPAGSYVLGLIGVADSSELSDSLLEQVARVGHSFALQDGGTYHVNLTAAR